MNVLSVKLRETREYPDQAGDGIEYFVRDALAFGQRFLWVRHFQVAHRDAAQARDGEIEQGDVEAGKTKGCMGQRPEEKRRRYSTQLIQSNPRLTPGRHRRAPRPGRA